MFDSTDPRSQLAPSVSAPIGTDAIAAPETLGFADEDKADTSNPGVKTWEARGENFRVRYVELSEGAELEWSEGRGYVLIVEPPEGVDSAAVSVQADSDCVVLEERGIIVVPSGSSRITTTSAVTVIIVVDTVDAASTVAMNEDSYAQPHPRVAKLSADSPAIDFLKAYPLSNFPAEEGRFGTIFRTGTLMINFLDAQIGPRDTEKLSPHHHDNFEQGSLTISGTWRHHIRTPWTTKLSQWRDDVHTSVEGPSLTIIPPPTIHTSRALGDGVNLMIDLFSPPRTDFAEKGWVVNADDFPLGEENSP